MNQFCAEQILEMARRVLAEEESGRVVDPSRLAWAREVLRITSEPKAERAEA